MSILWTLVVCLSVFAISAQAAEKKGKMKAAAAKATSTADETKADATATKAEPVKGDRSLLKTDQDKFSYLIGFDTGGKLKSNNIKVTPQVFTQALQDAIDGKAPALSDEEAKQTITNMQAAREKVATETLKKGEEFLEANKKKEGVKITASGLQYKVLKTGTGPTAKDGEQVVVKYRGTQIDGTEFDSSEKEPGGTRSFTIGQVIEGWNEAMKLMNKGSKWQLFIPSHLAYGKNGGPGGPNSALIFEVELVDIKPAMPNPQSEMPPGVQIQQMPRGATGR